MKKKSINLFKKTKTKSNSNKNTEVKKSEDIKKYNMHLK